MRYFQTRDKQIKSWEAVSNPRDSVFLWLAKQREHANGLFMYIQPLLGLKCRLGEACGSAEDTSSSNSQYEQQLQEWGEAFQMLSAVPKLRVCVFLPQGVNFRCPGVVACLKECLEEHSSIIWQLRTALDKKGTTVSHGPQTVAVDVLVQLMMPSSIKSLDYVVPGLCTSISTLSALTSLTQLTLRSETSKTLWDLWETLAALTTLQDLTCENMTSHGLLSSISGLTQLTAVRLTSSFSRTAGEVFGGSLTSLSFLQQLEVLHLDGAEWCSSLTSLEGLTGLSRLRELRLNSCTDLVNLEGISPAKTVEQLCLQSAAEAVSTSIAGREQQAPPSLQELELGCCPRITSLASLAGLSSSLRVLSMHSCEQLSSLEGIEQALSLQELLVIECPRITSLAPLAALCSLRVLYLSRCEQLSSIKGIEQILSLQELSIHAYPITSLAPLAGLSRLRALHLGDQLSSLAGDDQVLPSNVHELTLYLSCMTSLAALSGLRKLQGLWLHTCKQLTSLEGIQLAPLLQVLRVAVCPCITSLAPLSGLSSLQALYLQDCEQLSSLAGIKQSWSLRHLSVRRCPIVYCPLTLTGRLKKVLVSPTKGLDKTKLRFELSLGDRLCWWLLRRELLNELGHMCRQISKGFGLAQAVGLVAVVIGLAAALYRLLRPL
jgi:Leucine-rich repeat (LRR) protein